MNRRLCVLILVAVSCAGCSGDDDGSRRSTASEATTSTSQGAAAATTSTAPTRAAGPALALTPEQLRNRWNQAVAEAGRSVNAVGHMEMGAIRRSGDTVRFDLADGVVVAGPIAFRDRLQELTVTAPRDPSPETANRGRLTRRFLPAVLIAATLPFKRAATDAGVLAAAEAITIADGATTATGERSTSLQGVRYTVSEGDGGSWVFVVRKATG